MTEGPEPALLDPVRGRKPKFIRLFLDLAPKDLALITAAADAAALGAGAHRLKGSAFALGLHRLAHACEELERLGRAGDFDAALPMVTRLADVFDATSRALEDELAAQRPAASG